MKKKSHITKISDIFIYVLPSIVNNVLLSMDNNTLHFIILLIHTDPKFILTHMLMSKYISNRAKDGNRGAQLPIHFR